MASGSDRWDFLEVSLDLAEFRLGFDELGFDELVLGFDDVYSSLLAYALYASCALMPGYDFTNPACLSGVISSIPSPNLDNLLEYSGAVSHLRYTIRRN